MEGAILEAYHMGEGGQDMSQSQNFLSGEYIGVIWGPYRMATGLYTRSFYHG